MLKSNDDYIDYCAFNDVIQTGLTNHPAFNDAKADRRAELRKAQDEHGDIRCAPPLVAEAVISRWHKRQQAAYEASKSKAMQIAVDAAKAREDEIENEKAFAALAASGRFPRVRFYEEGAKSVSDNTQLVVGVGPAFDATTWVNMIMEAFALTSDVAVISNIADYTDVPSVVRLVNSITGAKINYALSY